MSNAISNLTTFPPEVRELVLTTLFGVELDLIPRYSSVTINTDLFRSFIIVSVNFNDGFDILKNLELIGGEDLSFKFKSQDSVKLTELNLKLYEVIGDQELTTHSKSMPVTLNFISNEKFIDSTKTISKKFTGTGSSIIKDILKTNLGSTDERLVNINSTTENLELWCNYKTSFKFVTMVCNYDLSLFYEELGGFSYINLTDLLNQNPTETLDLNIDNDSYNTFENIQKYRHHKLFNYLEMGNLGFFGTRLENIDPIYYQVNRTNKTNNEIMNLLGTIGNLGLINSTYDFKNSNVAQINHSIENIQLLNYFFTAMHLYSMEIELNGLTKRRVGDIIELTNFGYDNTASKNKKLSGKWIISNIVHVINKYSYKQRMIISKLNLGD